jgi:antitoxin component YwqK of YwqJK toxin-antitoxin module
LFVTESDPELPVVARGEEKTTPTDIDGQPGTVYSGWFVNGNPEYESTLVDGKQHGRERHWNAQGQLVTERHWKHGYWQGRYTHWYANGQKAEEADYDHFRLQGTHQTWYRNGQENTKTAYTDGLREGEFMAWHPNGTKRCRAFFAHDRVDGKWEKWDPDGKLLRQVVYRDGEVVSEWPQRAHEPFVFPGILGSPDFALNLSQGSGQHGYNTLRVSAAGRCQIRYHLLSRHVSTGAEQLSGLKEGEVYLGQVWREAMFQLSPAMQQQLREALVEAGIFGLRDEYVDKHIADGTQWVVALRAGGKEKRVDCSNRFPAALRKLSRTLRDLIVVPHLIDVITATTIALDKGNGERGNWLEDVAR